MLFVLEAVYIGELLPSLSPLRSLCLCIYLQVNTSINIYMLKLDFVVVASPASCECDVHLRDGRKTSLRNI